jgi:hypothetical protein
MAVTADKAIRTFIIGMVILGAVLLVLVMVTSPSEPARDQERAAVSSSQSSDDADRVVAHCGHFDRDDSTAYDTPRPLIPTRILEFRAVQVKAIFYPDAKVGSAPPYRWKLVGFVDLSTNTALATDVAMSRCGANH